MKQDISVGYFVFPGQDIPRIRRMPLRRNVLALIIIIGLIIVMAGMAVFNVAGYLVEERRRWPVINASPRGQ